MEQGTPLTLLCTSGGLPQGAQAEGAPNAEDGLKHLLLFIPDDTL